MCATAGARLPGSTRHQHTSDEVLTSKLDACARFSAQLCPGMLSQGLDRRRAARLHDRAPLLVWDTLVTSSIMNERGHRSRAQFGRWSGRRSPWQNAWASHQNGFCISGLSDEKENSAGGAPFFSLSLLLLGATDCTFSWRGIAPFLAGDCTFSSGATCTW
jgi:hypothetical protein